MKNILHVSYSKSGGAGRVADQLSTTQAQMNDYSSKFIYATKGSIRLNPFENIPLTVRASLDNYLIKHRNWPTLFSVFRNTQNEKLHQSILNHKDIVHLHWLGGVINLGNILHYQNIGKKLIWTIHDMEPMTGGCHYSIECKNFEKSCENCPAVNKIFIPKINKIKKSKDFIHSSLEKITYVFPTKWLLGQFRVGVPNSSLNLEFVPNPLERAFFIENSPKDRSDKNKFFVIGFVCRNLNDPIKQFGSFLEAIQKLCQLTSTPIKIIAVGEKFKSPPHELNFIIEQPGVISDQNKLIKFYAEMDVLVSNSFSESFGLTIAEAAASGVPSLVLEGSGSSELIINNETGFLFKDQTELISILLNIINSISFRQKIGENAKLFAAENWHIDKVIKKYDKLYENLN
jgi:glycosyltransferase involved in cell wall biosynthesis